MLPSITNAQDLLAWDRYALALYLVDAARKSGLSTKNPVSKEALAGPGHQAAAPQVRDESQALVRVAVVVLILSTSNLAILIWHVAEAAAPPGTHFVYTRNHSGLSASRHGFGRRR